MKHFTTLPLIAVALTCATPTFADITVDQAYDQMIKMMQIGTSDAPEVGNVVRSGSTLVANDIAFSMSEPDFDIETTIASITFTDQGDGSVLVEYADVMPITVSGDSPEGRFVAKFELIQNDTTYVLSGTPENTTYTYSAPKTILAIKDIDVPGDDAEIAGEITLTGGSGTYTSKTDELMHIDMDFAFENTVANLTMVENSAGEGGTFKMSLAGLAVNGEVSMPEDQSAMDTNNPFANGAGLDINYGYDSMSYDLDVQAEGEGVNATLTSGSGNLSIILNEKELAYGSEINDLDFTAMVPSALPFPVQASAKQLGLTMTVPVGKNERGAFEFGTNLREISVDDSILNMLDPGQIMPRDPVTLAFNLSGEAMWYFNLFDPEEAAQLENADIPGEIYNIELSGLDIQAVGASLTGEGAFTFDNSDFQTIPDMPRPEGALSLEMNGANGLIDRLIQMGIINDGDAMGARMMMGLIATPGAGEDSLTSTIEVNDQGHVSANGQRLR